MKKSRFTGLMAIVAATVLSANVAIAHEGGVAGEGNLGSMGGHTVLDSSGNLTILGSIFTAGGTCGGGCDYVFNPEYDLPSIEEHAASMWELGHLPAVGPTQEGAPFNLSDKTGRMLNELEKAHIYIEQLHQRLKQKEDALQGIQDRLARLEADLEVNR